MSQISFEFDPGICLQRLNESTAIQFRVSRLLGGIYTDHISKNASASLFGRYMTQEQRRTHRVVQLKRLCKQERLVY